jgi:hypothetical protein
MEVEDEKKSSPVQKKSFRSMKIYRTYNRNCYHTQTDNTASTKCNNFHCVHAMHLGCKLPYTVIIYVPEKVVDASK